MLERRFIGQLKWQNGGPVEDRNGTSLGWRIGGPVECRNGISLVVETAEWGRVVRRDAGALVSRCALKEPLSIRSKYWLM